jgi:hypothetical protein
MKSSKKTNQEIISEINKLKFEPQTIANKKSIQILQQQLGDIIS